MITVFANTKLVKENHVASVLKKRSENPIDYRYLTTYKEIIYRAKTSSHFGKVLQQRLQYPPLNIRAR